MSHDKFIDEALKGSAVNETSSGCADGCGCSEGGCGDQEGREGCGSGCGCGGHEAVEVNFFTYLTSIGYQAMIFLGEIPNPSTGENEKNLRQAKFIIDTIVMLKEKTRGNLSDQEAAFIEGTLDELQAKFLELVESDGLV